MLIANGIHHCYGDAEVLAGVDLAIAPGEVVGLGGPSGAGKTTLGRILAGLVRPHAGTVTLDGTPLPAPKSGRPMPAQYAPQAPELAMDPRWKIGRVLANGQPPETSVCQALGIRSGWADRYPAELSGGELARVSLARLILPTTRYLICDEVTASLDALAAAALWDALLGLTRARTIGVLLISHEATVRLRRSDRDVVLGT